MAQSDQGTSYHLEGRIHNDQRDHLYEMKYNIVLELIIIISWDEADPGTKDLPTPNSKPVIVSPQVLQDCPNSILSAHCDEHEATFLKLVPKLTSLK